MFASGSSSSNDEDKSPPTDNKTAVSYLGLLMCASFLFISVQAWKGFMGSCGWFKPVWQDIVWKTVTVPLLVIEFVTRDCLFVEHNTHHCVSQPCWSICMNTVWIKFGGVLLDFTLSFCPVEVPKFSGLIQTMKFPNAPALFAIKNSAFYIKCVTWWGLYFFFQ